ncbi:hypothetical protein EDD18DRAFT_1289047 [Armillaria luteobubalina]|uniref:Uncharacterized protein n=1 Tax=Armillaria luteobubalina TaxID=153913 RepID=A0AA39UJY8_9AGAR|nr:hypothetical protein EDD18DRAFT_1290204 [Armillaria luteobubalina]KAK0493852.1 hypothetical protein EDD18DRAFT_1289047 [Armillaria luteobubalina]
MPIVSPLTTKKVRRCFFVSLAFLIVIPIVCIVLGVTQHPAEFAYENPDLIDLNGSRTVFLHADLISADLKQGIMVLDWSIVFDTCDTTTTSCANVNIFFDVNLLQQTDTNSSESADNNIPTVPTFIWNLTAYVQDNLLSNSPRFQTELFVFRNYSFGRHPVKSTRSSDVYYPFDHYFTQIYSFAEDASTHGFVQLSIASTAGLVEGLKISPNVTNTSSYPLEGSPEMIFVDVTLERGTLIIIYCVVITITFWLVTLTICLLMIMTVAFGFQQRNEIVVVPIGVVFAFIQLRSTMPGAPDGFGDILDFAGVLPCLVLLSICAVTMVGIYIFTDPAKDSREKLTWSVLANALRHDRQANSVKIPSKNSAPESYDMLPLSRGSNGASGDLSSSEH